MKKRGQQTMGLPFGMIFAILLIIVFVVMAFMVVGHFLGFGKDANIGLFYKDLQEKVDDAWNGQSSESTFKLDGLPSEIEFICFADLKARITKSTGPGSHYDQIKDYKIYDANTFLIPPEKANNLEYKVIKHINISKIIEEKGNPFCKSTTESLVIKKDFYDKLVTIA